VRLVRDPVYGDVELTASADELSRLAAAVAEGEGLLGSVCSPGSAGSSGSSGDALAGVEVEATSGPGVLVRFVPERRILVISGDYAGRAVLADNVRAMACAEDGGHLHIEYFPGHFYLAEGSVPLVVVSPHGGMPTR